MGNKFDITVGNFPQLDQAAKNRVQTALHTALETELKNVGHAADGVFGDGSVKGMPTKDVIANLNRG